LDSLERATSARSRISAIEYNVGELFTDSSFEFSSFDVVLVVAIEK